MKKLLTILGLVVLAVVGAMALAVPPVHALEFKMRADNSVVLRGTALNDTKVAETPFGSRMILLAASNLPLDGPVRVLCDAAKECERVRRGDRLLVKGMLRVDSGASRQVYVVASDINLSEAK